MSSPAYSAEERALRRIHPNWGERDRDQRQADHYNMMWTMEALRDAGFTIEPPRKKRPSDVTLAAAIDSETLKVHVLHISDDTRI